ncbi:uncharacterized protein EURHEDRAFT_404316 [Aspergillus ruber CBS 135680]|uniref:Uncharacterized protein n=1 Tax=Aspergillus ruber (strain CBS 135680) TaxID=1388766 RepID=A0A017S967_ASPRC|nr:uncharacterized protein EURHEDRAFT_404316 [Aspergillus ruber CBS 135680]EYE93558.1 hypothetical protein EURHEDRAFT_404316 [Aspergillus ruber CBS 135680]
MTEFRTTKERFASVLSPRQIQDADSKDLDIIKWGNSSVHDGDCLLDVCVWSPKGRRADFDTFAALYGIVPNQVDRVASCHDTVDTINEHASVYTSKSSQSPQEYHDTFAAFVQELTASK